MMKKTILALAVAGVAAASVASAATVYDKDGTTLGVYGRVQAVAYSQDSNNTAKSGDAGIVGSGRLGIDARTDLGYGIAGIAKAEWDAADADGQASDGQDNFSARYMWVGADFGAFGKIYAGRTDTAIKYVNDTTDIFEDFGQFATFGADNKRSGQINYSWSGYGFDVNLAYQAAKDDSGINADFVKDINKVIEEETIPEHSPWGTLLPVNNSVKNAFSASAGYTSPDVLFGPIAVKAGYEYARYQDDTGSNGAANTDSALDNHKGWAAALSWGTDGVGPYVGVMYNERTYKFDNFGYKDTKIPNISDIDQNNVIWVALNGTDAEYKQKGVEAVVSYGFECGVQIKTGYEWRKLELNNAFAVVTGHYNEHHHQYPAKVKSVYDDSYKQAVVPVYINYNVNDNFNVWTEATFDAGSDDEVETENQYSVGARYTF